MEGVVDNLDVVFWRMLGHARARVKVEIVVKP